MKTSIGNLRRIIQENLSADMGELQILKPGDFDYPISLHQIAYHGSREPRPNLKDLSFITTDEDTAIEFCPKIISTYEFIKLPVLVNTRNDGWKKLISYLESKGFKYPGIPANLDFAKPFSQLMPNNIDGWWGGWEIMLNKPMSFLEFKDNAKPSRKPNYD